MTGAGTPLCDLVAYVTSPGPDATKAKKGDPIPATLRGFPDYYGKLYSPDKKFELTKFRTGSAFDDVAVCDSKASCVASDQKGYCVHCRAGTASCEATEIPWHRQLLP